MSQPAVAVGDVGQNQKEYEEAKDGSRNLEDRQGDRNSPFPATCIIDRAESEQTTFFMLLSNSRER